MSILHNSIKRSVVKVYHEEDTDLLGNICRTSLDCDTGGEVIAGPNMEAEKRIRREIANSNERRRMQSINAGFQSLRTLLPHHEGEKLSKAAILQQTAEYIYNLEQEKTRLLSQNCQLMRQVQQHEGDVPPKKRIKTEMIIPLAAATDEHGNCRVSMSPEPLVNTSTSISTSTSTSASANSEMMELRRQLDRERSVRVHLEEQIRTMESQLYQQMQMQQQYHHHHHQQQEEELEETQVQEEVDGCNDESILTTVIQDASTAAITVALDVDDNHLDDNDDADDDADDKHIDEDNSTDVIDEDNTLEMQLVQPENVPLVGQTETVVCCSPPQIMSPLPPDVKEECMSPPRLPSVLEAAIKAEPKVEVERLPTPGTSSIGTGATIINSGHPHDDISCSRLYVANTSRQNLETIVEAIRHLEGDHLFSDEPPVIKLESKKALTPTAPTALTQTQTPSTKLHTTKSMTTVQPIIKKVQTQEAPLALTTKCGKVAVVAPLATTERAKAERPSSVKVEMKQYFQFHTNNTHHHHHHQYHHQQQQQQHQQLHYTQQQQQQQSRPGVIVVKQHS